jgi:hypothetical protein
MISSRESRSLILAVIICRNSSKSMVPLRAGRAGRARGDGGMCGGRPRGRRAQRRARPPGAARARRGAPAVLVDVRDHLLDLLLLGLEAQRPGGGWRDACAAHGRGRLQATGGLRPAPRGRARAGRRERGSGRGRSCTRGVRTRGRRQAAARPRRERGAPTAGRRAAAAGRPRRAAARAPPPPAAPAPRPRAGPGLPGPAHRIATLSSLASMVPEPSVSNRSKASRISCFCSSVRPVRLPFSARLAATTLLR